MAGLLSAPFKVGAKEWYLPSFHISLHRNAYLGPKYATFTVPLWFNKLDLRDYLYHVYSVRIISVRSYIKLQKITQGKPSYIPGERNPRPQYKRWHRPKSVKRMTVELESPFVWPAEPVDYAPWNKKQMDAVEAAQKKSARSKKPEEGTTMGEQARDLLEGRAKWSPPAVKDLRYRPER